MEKSTIAGLAQSLKNGSEFHGTDPRSLSGIKSGIEKT
jgi:hypothetical protein